MRRTLAVVMALALVWGGYWWSGATAMERGMRGWLDARAAEGWVARYDSVETRGFPSRFDTSFRGLEIAAPGSPVTWRAPLFQTLMVSYEPNRAVAAWPGPQVLETPAGPVRVEGEALRASVRLGLSSDLPLDKLVLEARALAVDGPGWAAGASEAWVGLEATPLARNGQRLRVTLREVAPPGGLRARADPEGAMPAAVERFDLDAVAALGAPLDRHALEERAPAVTALSVRRAALAWGAIAAEASGEVVMDARGRPEGRIEVRVEGWRALLGLLRDAGVVGARYEAVTRAAMEALAGLSPGEDVIEAPLVFSRGLMSFGPIPLGPIPGG